MSNLTEFPDLALAREQAADWISRLSRGLTEAEQADFRRWRASPANERALRQLSKLWGELDVLRELATVFPEPGAAARPAPRLRRWRAAIAAGLAGLLATGGVGVYQHYTGSARATSMLAAEPASSYATAVGELRNVPLPDGSQLAINTASLVEVVALGQRSRELRLVRGEAHFTVAHDATRPFRVNAAGHVVQAIGTAFDVRLHADGALEVIVTDGHVKLLSGNGTVGDLLRGQVLRIDAAGGVHKSTLDDATIASRLAWRSGGLAFDGQTLGDVIEEFSRYTPDRLVVGDPALLQRRVGGYFPAGDTDALLEGLRENFGIASARDADGTIRIGIPATAPRR